MYGTDMFKPVIKIEYLMDGDESSNQVFFDTLESAAEFAEYMHHEFGFSKTWNESILTRRDMFEFLSKGYY